MANKATGYILIYVIGILVFLGLVGLGVAYTLRINAQLVLNEKEIMQNDRLLESAVQYTLAQLTKAKIAEPVVKAMEPSAAAKLGLWKKGGGLYRVQIQGQDIVILLEDAGDLPDINALTKEEIQRIFESFGASSVEAVALTEVLVKAREKAGRDRGGNGFATLQQVLGIEAIPPSYRFGIKSEGEGLENSLPPPDMGMGGDNPLNRALERAFGLPGAEVAGKPPALLQPGLDKLVVVGTGIKSVNLNRAPLPVIFALVKTDAAALAKFDTARKTKPLTVADAAQILGEPARQALRDGDSSMYRIKLIMEKFGRIYGAVAIAREEGGNFKMLSYRISQSGDEQ